MSFIPDGNSCYLIDILSITKITQLKPLSFVGVFVNGNSPCTFDFHVLPQSFFVIIYRFQTALKVWDVHISN